MIHDARITHFGRLELVEVYEFYDRPVLYVCRNAVGVLYLVVLINETRLEEAWLYLAMTEGRYQSVRSGLTDLNTAFRDAEDGYVALVRVPFASGVAVTVEPRIAYELTPDLLPLPGERLDLPTDTLPRFVEPASVEAKRSRRDILKLALKLPEVFRSEAPAKFLGQVLTTMQDAVSSIAQSFQQSAGRRGTLPRRILEASELDVLAVGASSFEVKLASASASDLFGKTSVSDAIEEFVRLLQTGSEADALQARLGKLEGRAAANYLAFLKALDKEVEAVRAEFGTPWREESLRADVSAVTVRAAIAVLEYQTIESRDVQVYRGRLTGVSLTKKTFEITFGAKKKDTVNGRIADEAVAFVEGAVVNSYYEATVEITQSVKMATGEIQEAVTLIKLAPVDRPVGN